MDPRPHPESSSEIERTPIAQVLCRTALRRFTGTLTVTTGQAGELAGETVLVFDAGAVAQVRLPQTVDPLGFVLYEQGIIDTAQWNESLARVARGEGLQGEVLVKMRACDARQVEQGLRDQLRRKVARLFALSQGRCAFYSHEDRLEDFGGARFPEPVLPMLWNGARAHPRNPAVDAVLRALGDTPLRLRPGASVVNDLALGSAERHLVETLRRGNVTADQFLAYGASGLTARALLYLLVVTKQVERMPAWDAAARAAEPAPPPPGSTKISGVMARVEGPAPRVSGTDLPAVRAAEGVAPSRCPPERRAMNAIERLADAEARLESMDAQSYFEILGLPPGAAPEAVPGAFIPLARAWHPDTAPPGALALREVLGKIFALLSEAESTLRDRAARERYLRDARAGYATPRARRAHAVVAATAMQAQEALRRKDLGAAMAFAREALAAEPGARDALLVLATAVIEQHPNGPFDEALVALARLVNADPPDDQAHFLMGTIARRQGQQRLALAHFHKAWKLNPNNVDAVRELRLAALRDRGAARAPAEAETSRAPSILQKLFGRRG